MNRWTSVLLAFGGLIAFPLVDSAIKGTLILVLAAAVCLWLRRDSAATRHFVWTIAIGLLVAMPVLSLVLPQWRILPGWMNSEPVTLQQISLPTLPSEATLVEADVIDEPAQPIAFENPPADMSDLESDVLNVPAPMTDNSPADAVSAIDPVEESATTLPAWISVTWLIGCALLLVRLFVAAMMLRRSERRCIVVQYRDRDDRRDRRAGDVSPLMNARNPNQGTDIPRSPEELGIALEQSKLALGLKRPVVLLLDPKRSIPIVWGLWKTRLQLPKEALQWSDEQLQSVLLHELAHVRRRDLFVLALTQIACALHWFNPLVWIAAWRLHVERERACDDLVLNTGIRASSYAEHLLNVATRLTSSQWTQACGLAMARNSLLHGRLSAVLSEKQNRRSVTTALAIGLIVTATAIAAPMAMLRGSDDTQTEDAQTDITNGSDDTPSPGQQTGAGVFNEISEKPIPFTEAFNNLAWGDYHESGLRAAIVMDREGDSVPLGTVVKRKLILHNRGKQSIKTFRLSVEFDGQQLSTAGLTTMPGYDPEARQVWPSYHSYRVVEVPADSCIAVDVHSDLGFGDDFDETQLERKRFWQRVPATVGDVVSTTAEIDLAVGTELEDVLKRNSVKIKTGETKLRLLPWIPDAPRKVRTADVAGNYIVADDLRLLVKRIGEGSDQYTARLVCSKPTTWESEAIAITSPFKFAWTRHSGEVWLAESSGVRRFAYTGAGCEVSTKHQPTNAAPERLQPELSTVSGNAAAKENNAANETAQSQPIVNNLGSSGNYRPAAILPRIPRTAPTNNRDSTRPLLERLSDDPDQRAKELVYLLRDYRIWIRSDEWAEATRELVKLGDVALPYLIAELDRTDRDQTLRAVAFALRAINNPRAVPALIRAVPKALRPPGSDCGVYVRTKELHEFMTAIDHSPGANDDVSLGRPVTEIFSALGHLTSHKFGDDDELSSVFLEDPADETKLRKQFTDRQREWLTWWSEHGPELIPADELPRWNQASAKTLDAAGRDDIERAGIARFGELFPTGPDVRLGPVRELELSWPGFADAVCAIDFDEHRGIRRFELYDDGGRHFQAVHSGADLSASELVKEYDLCLWHSTNEQWSSIDQDIRNGQRISIAREAHQRTLRAATGQQTYAFLTREGGQGIVQIDELDQSRNTRKIRYRMWNDTDVSASVGLPKPDSPSTVSWSAVHKARLAAPGPQSLSAWSLNNHQAVAVPDGTPEDFFDCSRNSAFYSLPEFVNWMVDEKVSLIFAWADYSHNRRNLPEDYLKTIRRLPAIQVMNCRRAMLISPDGFDTLSAADAAEFPDALLSSFSSSNYVPGTHESSATSIDAAVFHLTDGTVGLFEITNRHAADGAIEFRYKTVVTAKKADGHRVEARGESRRPNAGG